MYIEGIGTIRKEQIRALLGDEIYTAYCYGDVSEKEITEKFKFRKVQAILTNTIKSELVILKNYERIPQKLKDSASPEILAELVQAFTKCFFDGKKSAEKR